MSPRTDAPHRTVGLTRWLVSAPPVVFLLLFFLLPSLLMVAASFRYPGEFGGLAPRIRDYLSNGYFLKLTGNTHDFYALQYYFHFKIKFPQKITNENKWVSDMGWEKYPEGILHLLEKLAKVKKPIYITENGVADADDKLRPRYIAQHIHQIWRAVNFNFPIKGYFHWSLTDNVEWDHGWFLRFGLWALDEKTQKRTKRPSADFYAELCKVNGLSSETVQKYCPEVFEKLFPF